MNAISSIITKSGDAGHTKLVSGETVSKADLQVEAYGTIDELNSFLGLARAACDNNEVRTVLERLQRETFVVGAELAATPEVALRLKNRVSPEMTAALDADAARIEALPGVIGDWALPGAVFAEAAVDVARSVARRAERCAVRLANEGGVPNDEVLRYLNRMSDVLWLLGRKIELDRNVEGALRPERAHK
ncbi:MAG TPA: cob(I)yrinic acid a,c-diamide adenosyltransferase [Abditibacteriaceae bacterium]|jgi:cob(I)alamin adenosyltransferase